jgi:hypothetical protein
MNQNKPVHHPLVSEFRDLLAELKPTIEDDFRAYDDCEDDNEPSLLVTFASNDGSEWGFQTGDNSYSGGAYFYRHWASVALYRDSDCLNLAIEAFDEIMDGIAQDDESEELS